MWKTRLVTLFIMCAVPNVEGTFRGDPIQTFKRMRYGDQKTMWSDVLVGQVHTASFHLAETTVSFNNRASYSRRHSLQ